MNLTLNAAADRAIPYFKYGMIFFLYFFIFGGTVPFLAIWLGDAAKLDAGAIGLLFASLAIFALLLQPVFGLLTDRLDNRKHLLWCIIALLVLLAPYMKWVFVPLLTENLLLGVCAGGIYLGIIFAAGAGTLEAYIEKACRAGDITYGRVRMFGAIGYGSSAAVSGTLISSNPESIFWIGSGCALVLALLFWRIRPSSTVAQTDGLQEKPAPVSYATVKKLLFDRRFWFLVLYVVGVACLYDVFDQQFVKFFCSFFDSPQQGTRVFGFITTLTEGSVALMMFCIPWVLTRIGGKNALIVAGFVMSLRIIGSGFASSPAEVVALKMLHALEVPLIYIGMFKYIEDAFDARLSATIYMAGFVFAKGLGISFISPLAGYMYEAFGFREGYLLLGSLALLFTVVSIFTLDRGRHKSTYSADTREDGPAVIDAPALFPALISK
ncbi:MFS transporter, OHS family, lactose permease [Azotobacter beijerinckii]|uniref:MFS transporter, OHS family, lactose permease n=1 Tax=Azotobacter beijerinckii TaxID=170623 RepID=A0A1H9Q207_9GAMM|nr:oligosaccharide MFS transporter [Azotobacter beijerinckii]SEJ39193.1 MFS transporter, OHS family, lactose permease [Azotobacter beijerinckii]SER54491.1 MFS transporter, OHS family, lactose permease [Azotobacter beijerinckii]